MRTAPADPRCPGRGAAASGPEPSGHDGAASTPGHLGTARVFALGATLALSLAVLALSLAALGCDTAPRPDPDSGPARKPAAEGDPAAAARVVTDLLAALRKQDCTALLPLLGGPVAARLQGKDCKEVIAGERLAKIGGVRVGEARRDGRDPRAFMVPVHLGHTPDAPLVLLRVELSNGEYRVVEM